MKTFPSNENSKAILSNRTQFIRNIRKQWEPTPTPLPNRSVLLLQKVKVVRIQFTEFPSSREAKTEAWENDLRGAKLLSCVWLFATPWTVAFQAPLSMGILQVRILEWVAMPFSRGSSQPKDQTQISHIAGRFFPVWTIREFQPEIEVILLSLTQPK